jgi:hypothetical protein
MTVGPLKTFGGALVNIGPDARAVCETFETGTPRLSVDSPAMAVTLFLPGRGLEAHHLRFVRELAEAAREFADECERLYADQGGPPGPDWA